MDNANSPIAAWNLYEVVLSGCDTAAPAGTALLPVSASAHGSGAGMLGALWGDGSF